jgi:branched-subunit amino acid transport protein
MDYNIQLLTIAIIIIGLNTLFLRSVFLFYLPEFTSNPVIQKGMQVVPASMLVALVIPFLIFRENELQFFTIEVAAILLTIPIIYKLKNPGYGIIIAFSLYFILQLITSIF